VVQGFSEGAGRVLLLSVLLLGVGSSGGNLLAFASLPLLGLLLCPLTMGAMMWLMMRKH